MVNFLLYRHIKLFLSISDVSRLHWNNWLTKLTEELFPEADLPSVKTADALDTLHACHTGPARILEQCVFVKLYYGPYGYGLLTHLHLLSFKLIVVEKIAVLARV